MLFRTHFYQLDVCLVPVESTLILLHALFAIHSDLDLV
jgi:hypothetical protein